MKKIIFLFMLSFFSFSMEAQFVNRFKDSSYFKLGVKFDSAITFIKDAGEGKVLTSDSNGYAQWRTPLVYVTEKQLSDSIVSVRMYRNVDTIYKNISEDSIIFLIKGTRYSITDNDNSFSTFTMFKNVSGDSIITIHDGVRLAVKDSTGTQDLSLYVPYTGATTNINIGNNNYIGLYKSNTNSNLSTLITRSSTGLEQNISADAYKLLNTNISNRIGMYGGSNATIGASNAYSSVVIAANNVTEASSGNHPIISQLAIRPIYLAGSSATTTNASTLYIEDATTPIGGATISNNYAMWVDKGISRFDSSIILFSEPVNSILALNSSSKITSLDTSLYPSLLELSYVKGTDSSIQKQLTKKVNSNTEITINNVTQDLSQSRQWTITPPELYISRNLDSIIINYNNTSMPIKDSIGVSLEELIDSINVLRQLPKIDTLYKSNDTIFYKQNQQLLFFKDSIGSSIKLSDITAATATNTIDNEDKTQTWTWNSISNQSGLKLSSTANGVTSNTKQKLFESVLTGAMFNTSNASYAGYFDNQQTLGGAYGIYARGFVAAQLEGNVNINGALSINNLRIWNNSGVTYLNPLSNQLIVIGGQGGQGAFIQANGALYAFTFMPKVSGTSYVYGLGCSFQGGTYVSDKNTAALIERNSDKLMFSSNSGLPGNHNAFTPTFQLTISGATNNIGIGTTSPNVSAKLDVSSTTQGFAPPEMTAAQASAIITTNRKIIIYVTNTNATFTSAGLWMWNGTLWKLIMSE